MICRSCGTEIAAKALVCYRCGAPTAEGQPRPAARRGSRRVASPTALVAALLVILVAAVLVVPQFPPGMSRVAAYGAVALVTFLVVRTLRGRRNR